jgi:hypothetical protein
MLEVRESDIVGKGVRNSTYSYLRHIPTPQPTVNLKNERGIAFRTAQSVAVEPTIPEELAVERRLIASFQSQRKSVTDKTCQKTLDEADKNHIANICRSLEHRLQVAKAKGDTNLLRLLEAESAQISFCRL